MSSETGIKKQEQDVTRVERTRDRRTYTPNVDILEMEDELVVLADMPGTRPNDIDIQYEQGLLTIHGRVEPRREEGSVSYLLQEYGVGDYYRSFKVGEGIDPSKIEARLKDGVMELHLPKAEAVKPRKITVQTK